MPPECDGLLDGVTRRAGNVGDDDAVKAGQAVEKTGFSGVRAAQNDGPDAGLHHPAPMAGGKQRGKLPAAFCQRRFIAGEREGVDILVGVIEHGVEMRAQIDPAVVDRVDLFADRTCNLSGGVCRRVGCLGVDEIDHGFGLRQIHLAVQKRAAREFTGPRLPETCGEQRFKPGGQCCGGAVALNFGGILAGVGMRGAGDECHAVVDGPSLCVKERAERKLAVGEGRKRPAGVQPEDLFRGLNAPVAG